MLSYRTIEPNTLELLIKLSQLPLLSDMPQSPSSNTSIPTDSTQPIVESPTEFPQFHGGYDAMMNYFANNLTYPEAAEIEGIQGRVIVRFVVNTDGSIGDVRVLRSVHKTVDSEAIRLVRNMPKWIPGKLNGKPVRTEFTVPITFRLK